MKEPIYTLEDFLNVRNSHSPSMSPSGDWVAYVSNEDTDTFQVWVSRRDGSETRRLTDYADGVNVSWSKSDEDLLLLSKDTDGDENNQLYLLRVSTGKVMPITDNPKAKHIGGSWSKDGRKLSFSTNETNGTDFELRLRDMDTGEIRTVFNPGGYCMGKGFSPSGRYLLGSKANSNIDNNLFIIDLENDREPVLITSHEGVAMYSYARWLPDESGFFLVSDQEADISGVWFFEVASNSLSQILNPSWGVDEIALNSSGDRLLVVFNEDGYSRTELYKIDGNLLGDKIKHTLPKGELSDFSWSADGKYLVFSGCTYDRSYNVWVWNVEIDYSERITSATMGVPNEVMVEPVLDHYSSFDGLSIPIFVYLPKKDSTPVPAIVHIHGGPEAQYRPGFASLIQYFVCHGYAVIAPNIRGSAGYGKMYLSLDDRDKRLDSVKDLQSLHSWAQTFERVDASRMALMGGSYGGYMVLAGLAFQPDLWAAGVDIVGISNLETFLENTSSYRRALRESEYGYLATDREFLKKASPINKVDEMIAPLMIIHGSNDPRVPLSEAEQIRDKLAERGVIAKLLIYPDEGHGLSKRRNRLDAYPKVMDFLDEVLMSSSK